MMSGYKYQMHCHTSPCSACGRITPYELVYGLRNNGYAGAVITNHFYIGNSGIDKSLSWKKFVSFYEKDYYDCKRFADTFGIDILFGIEEHIGGGREILCYGLTPSMLYSHPELKQQSLELWYNTLSPSGVIIIQAHPFRHRSYTTAGVLPLDFLDGLEVFNCGNSPEDNLAALEFARQHPEIIKTCGADAHLTHQICKGGIISEQRIRTESDLSRILRSRTFSLITE